MAFTQADADALRRNIARGVRKLKIDGEEIEYASLADMKNALAMIEAELAGTANAGFATIYPRMGRGL